MRGGRLVLFVVGVLVALIGFGFGAAGLVLGWTHLVHRDAEGFVSTPSFSLESDGYALTAERLEVVTTPGPWTPWEDDLELRMRVTPAGDSEQVFAGIASRTDVAAYLDGVAHDEVGTLDARGGRTSTRPGEAVPEPPGSQDFWVSSAQGTGEQTVEWTAETGEWAVVVMNADATPGLAIEVDAGARTGLLGPIAAGLLLAALLVVAVGTALVVAAVPDEHVAPAVDAPRTGPSPVTVTGNLDAPLSRWQWLVKWVLLIPHFVVLALLWVGFVLLTIVAGFAILFTGRYPRGIFDVNVGILRWTWRVAFYGYSALGTDRYPPFTLADVDYPARLDVTYPRRLSRGLVLVKSWLLALPHLLIVGVLTGGGLAWTFDATSDRSWELSLGGGLIGILALVAGVALLFTARYPAGLFDLLVGLNRWVFRVVAYVALMTDEYPPFRLDSGGHEPAVPPGPPPSPGDAAADAPSQAPAHGSHPTPA